MSTLETKAFLETYADEAPATQFLTSLARSKTQKEDKIEIDIERDTQDIAIVITDLSQGGRQNSSGLSQNNEFAPPLYLEQGSITAEELTRRQLGASSYAGRGNDSAIAVYKASKLMQKMAKKIIRSVELQSAQVLQTGAANLTNAAGTSLYNISYGAKVSHFPTAGTAWTNVAAPALLDLENLCDVINVDGHQMPNRAIMGRAALRNFLKNTEVLSRLDKRNLYIGEIGIPVPSRNGETYHGRISVGPYVLELWAYASGTYTDPATGTSKTFVNDNSVIILSDKSRFDAVFGGLTYIAAPEDRAKAFGFLPGAVKTGGIGFTTNAWFAPDNTSVNMSIGTRPLWIPTAIDTFGCLTTA